MISGVNAIGLTQRKKPSVNNQQSTRQLSQSKIKEEDEEEKKLSDKNHCNYRQQKDRKCLHKVWNIIWLPIKRGRTMNLLFSFLGKRSPLLPFWTRIAAQLGNSESKKRPRLNSHTSTYTEPVCRAECMADLGSFIVRRNWNQSRTSHHPIINYRQGGLKKGHSRTTSTTKVRGLDKRRQLLWKPNDQSRNKENLLVE